MPDAGRYYDAGRYCRIVGEGENVVAIMFFMEVQIVCVRYGIQ